MCKTSTLLNSVSPLAGFCRHCSSLSAVCRVSSYTQGLIVGLVGELTAEKKGAVSPVTARLATQWLQGRGLHCGKEHPGFR